MDYANAKIYTIRSFQTEKYYIGSTTSTLTKRLSQHKTKYKCCERYCTSAEIIQYGDAYIELLEDFPCFKKDQLCKREGQLIREHKDNCVNIVIAGRTNKEWREDNKEKLSEQNKQYREQNREHLEEYYETNKEHILEQRKLWREQNKEHKKKYNRQYYQHKRDQAKLISADEEEAKDGSITGVLETNLS